MTMHIKKASEKAGKIINAMTGIMPKVRGRSQKKRRLIATVVQSVILYAAPAWEDALKYKRYVKILRSIERKASICVTSAYRTASTNAVGVLAGYPPYGLLAWERARNWESRGTCKEGNRQEIYSRWQERWARHTGWTSILIKNVKEWQERGPATNYYATQAILGHGAFGSYLKKIKRLASETCWYGCEDQDTPRHTVFECRHFAALRQDAQKKIGRELDKNSISEVFLETEDKGREVMNYLTEVMMEKEREEKRREKHEDTNRNVTEQ
nr:uncharacterized protein LOC111418053 [Onthophagus taurus]